MLQFSLHGVVNRVANRVVRSRNRTEVRVRAVRLRTAHPQKLARHLIELIIHLEVVALVPYIPGRWPYAWKVAAAHPRSTAVRI